jgi:creatinine amidohydrolase/Fe(II)-dependent formamide hydrolase-like protein
MTPRIALAGLAGLLTLASSGFAQTSVFLEDLTWVEVRDAVRAGTTTVMIPTGGTEQGGPHLVLGKHNYVMKATAEMIAKRLGKTLVAPVMAYVPEGNVDPPSSHMWGPGTITLPPEHFAKVVEYAARSLRQHGFLDILLIGDSGGNQAPMKAVADLLNGEWSSTPVRVYHLDRYNSNPEFLAWLKAQGYTMEQIGSHAAIRDTSDLMAAHLAGVRMDRRSPGPLSDGSRSGVVGDPTKASVEYGRKALEMKVEAAVSQYQELRKRARPATP